MSRRTGGLLGRTGSNDTLRMWTWDQHAGTEPAFGGGSSISDTKEEKGTALATGIRQYKSMALWSRTRGHGKETSRSG